MFWLMSLKSTQSIKWQSRIRWAESAMSNVTGFTSGWSRPPRRWSRPPSSMLAKAGLAGWNVRLREIETDARTTKTDYEVIRDNPTDGGLDRLGISGERYGVVQNEQAFAMNTSAL